MSSPPVAPFRACADGVGRVRSFRARKLPAGFLVLAASFLLSPSHSHAQFPIRQIPPRLNYAAQPTPLAPPPRQGTRPGNLRAALTSFVGRDDELERVLKQLGESRLVTLVGPGGAGKTRLASVAAARLSAGTDGGAWLVELAPVTDPAAVPRAILTR